MSAPRVLLRPSDHEFIAEGHESLLQAGLKAGLAVPYGCSNGSCGECLARLVSGEVEKLRQHDYPLSEGELRQGMILMCANRPISREVVLDIAEAGSVADIPVQEITVRVKTVELLNDRVARVHARTPRSRRLRFLAGQSVDLALAGSEKKLRAPLASCPCDDMNLEFHLPRRPGEPVSEALMGHSPPGELELSGPHGDFVLGDDGSHPLIFVAEETAFAPVRSLIEHAMSLNDERTMGLYWLAGGGEGHYLANLCRSWADSLDDFRFVKLEEGSGEDLAERIVADNPDLFDFEVFFALRRMLPEAARRKLSDAGLPRDRLRVRKFP